MKERIKILKAEIREREHELFLINKKLLEEEKDTHTRFVIWANNGLEKRTHDSIPRGYILDYCKKYLDLGSMRGVVNLMEMDNSFGIFCEEYYEGYEDDYEDDIKALKEDKVFIGACEEMIKLDIDSFEIDW